MEGVAGIVKPEQVTGGDPMYEEARRLYTEEINAAVRGAKAAGATEIVVMDCHGAGKGWEFNSLVPDLLDPACEYVVQERWTEYTGFRGRLRRRPVRGDARAGGHARRRAEPHRLGAGMAEPALQRGSRRRDGDQRGALRDLGLSGPARDGRPGDVRRGAGASRSRPHDRRGEAGPRPPRRPPDPAAARAGAARPGPPGGEGGGADEDGRGGEDPPQTRRRARRAAEGRLPRRRLVD